MILRRQARSRPALIIAAIALVAILVVAALTFEMSHSVRKDRSTSHGTIREPSSTARRTPERQGAVDIPNVIGQSATMATSELTRTGLRIGIHVEQRVSASLSGFGEVCDVIPVGQGAQPCHRVALPEPRSTAELTKVVVQQDPPAGSRASPGTRITVLVAAVYALPQYLR